MGNEKIAVDGALVLCSWTVQPSAEGMADKMNFRIYRILEKGAVDNGVYGTDEAILCEKDCEPYINLKPFPFCQSPSYIEAMGDLQEYWYSLISKYDRDTARQELVRAQYAAIGSFLEEARAIGGSSGGDRKRRNYHCVLQLLDHWFNTSGTVYIDSFYRQKKAALDAIEKELESLEGQQLDFSRQAWKKMPEAYQNRLYQGLDDLTGGQGGKGGQVNMADYLDGLKDSQEDNASTLYEDYRDLMSSVNSDQEGATEKDKDDYGNIRAVLDVLYRSTRFEIDLLEALNGLTFRESTVNGRYFDDDFDEFRDRFADAKDVALEYQGSVDDMVKIAKAYGMGAKANAWKACVDRIVGEITKLEENISGMKDDLDLQAVVTKDSYRVCRCSGVIRIMDDGQWVETVDFKIRENFVKMLQAIEEQLWTDLQGKPKGKCPNYPTYENERVATRYSLMLAINMVQDLLASLDSKGKYVGSLKSSYQDENEKVLLNYPVPKVIIDLTPQNEKEKEEARKDIIRELADMLPFGLNWVFRVLFFAKDMSDSYTPVEEAESMKKLAGSVLEDGAKKVVQEGRKMADKRASAAAGTLDDAINSPVAKGAIAAAKWYKLLEEAMTQSYALYIGQIDVQIHTGWDEYKYRAEFNGEGEMSGSVKKNIAYVGTDPYAAYTNYRYAANGIELGGDIQVDIFKE